MATFDSTQLSFFDPVEPQFSGRIRHADHKGVTVYSLVDIMREFSESENEARKYWNDTKKRLMADGFEVSEKIGQLKLIASDGKSYKTDVADAETCIRIVQSIPSPKAEPIRLWLAHLGFERLEEARTPGLASQRARQRDLSALKRAGYSDHEAAKSLELRIQGIDTVTALKNTIQRVCIDTPMYGQIFNAEYLALFGYVAKQLRELLNTKDIRESLPRTQYIYLQAAESSLHDILERQGQMPNDRIVELARSVCSGLGDQLRFVCNLLGTHPVTGQPLLSQ